MYVDFDWLHYKNLHVGDARNCDRGAQIGIP